jgi:2,5-furandicarboxylate decarboxylase 1
MTEPDALDNPNVFSMRQWIGHLDKTGRLSKTKAGVPLDFTLAAISKKLDGRQATLFSKPDGHETSVISGIVSRREWIAEAIGVKEDQLLKRFRDAVNNPIPWQEIKNAPAQDVQYMENIDLNHLLPIPVHNEHDNGKYITAGLVIARNPQTGDQNVSINRLQISGKDRLGVLILPRDLHKVF